MITKDNVKEVMDAITKKDIDTVIDAGEDFILLELHIFNTGGSVSITCLPYSEEVEQEANDNGQLFCDFDTFLQLFKDSESVNPFLIELI